MLNGGGKPAIGLAARQSNGGDMNHSRPAHRRRIAWLFELARRHGEAFRSPDAWLARQRYLPSTPPPSC